MKRLVLWLLAAYQRLLSPLLVAFSGGPACRYVPTCSEYAAEAVELHGPWRGGLKAAWRLLRCHPFARGGYDPCRAPFSTPVSLGEKIPTLCAKGGRIRVGQP